MSNVSSSTDSIESVEAQSSIPRNVSVDSGMGTNHNEAQPDPKSVTFTRVPGLQRVSRRQRHVEIMLEQQEKEMQRRLELPNEQ